LYFSFADGLLTRSGCYGTVRKGAAKLQFLDLKQKSQSSVAERNQIMQRWDADRVPEDGESDYNLRRRQRRQQEEEDGLMNDAQLDAALQMTPQESLLLRVLVFWALILIYTTWLYPVHSNPAHLVGILVNINLVIFFAAPLKTIRTVVEQRNSISIHYETMVMNWVNTSFWIAYGCARRDIVILLPNATGLMLGLAQGVLCMIYPRQSHTGPRISLHELEEDLMLHPNGTDAQDNPEVIPTPTSPARAAMEDKNQVQDTPEII
jgi:Sugar efflux transporter for intercellular exchange